jgi:hypothetical protein
VSTAVPTVNTRHDKKKLKKRLEDAASRTAAVMSGIEVKTQVKSEG